MNIQLVCGKNSSGKSTYLYSKAIRRAATGKYTIVLVPEQYTLEAEKAIISAKEKQTGLINIQVMSITRLISWVFENVTNPNLTILDDIGKTLIIKSILKKHSDELKVYGSVSNTPGFCGYMNDLINDLGRFNVSQDDLSSASGEDISKSISDKIHDVLLVMEHYKEYNSENSLLDSNDLIDFLCTLIDEKSDEIIAFFKDKLIIFDSYDYYPPKNISLIMALASVSDGISAAITADTLDNSDLYAAGQNSIENIEAMAKALDAQIEYKYCEHEPQIANAGISHIRKYLNTYPVKQYNAKSEVYITKATGINEEVEAAACKIIELLVNEDYSFNDINIICSSLDAYKSYITRIFRKYDLPIFIDDRRSVFSHPVVVFLLSALNFAENRLRNFAINLLKTGYLNISTEDIEIFEDYAIENNIQGTMFNREFKRGAKKYDLEKQNHIRQALVNSISDIDISPKSTKMWAKQMLDLIAKNNLEQVLLDESERLIHDGLLDTAAETAQAWNVILNVIEQLHNISGDDALALNDFVQLIEESFSSIQIGVLPTNTNSITVGDIGRSKYTSTKAVFILGANEGQLPPPLPQGAILGDDELTALKEKSIIAGRDREFRKKETAHNLYTAITSANEKLFISYDSAGGKQPALLINKIRNLLPDIYIDTAYINPMAHPSAALTLSAKSLGAIGDMRPVPDGAWQNALGALIADKKYETTIDKMYNFAAGDENYNSSIIDHDKNMVTSISQLEEYAKCPFAYMISYGLHPALDPNSEIEYTSSGAFLHKLMEDFGKELESIDVANTNDKDLDIIIQKKAKYLAAVFDDGMFTIDAKSEFLAQQLIETARRSSKIYVENLRRSDFVPIAHELTFDIGRKFGPIKIDLPDGKTALLKGKIDRVDEFSFGENKWLRAIDYKSGRKSIDLSGLITGENIQLFTYMNALTKQNDNLCAGVFYFPLRNDYADENKSPADLEKMDGWFVDNAIVLNAMDNTIDASEKSEIINLALKADKTPNKRNTSIKSNEYMKAALDIAEETAVDLVNKIYSGKMAPCPIKDKQTSSCTYCEYNNICRYGAQTFNYKNKPSKQKADAVIKAKAESQNEE